MHNTDGTDGYDPEQVYRALVGGDDDHDPVLIAHPGLDPVVVVPGRAWLLGRATAGALDLTEDAVLALDPLAVVSALERHWPGGLMAFLIRNHDNI